MNNWKITALYFGQMTLPTKAFGGVDDDVKIDIPILGFLLRNGKENVLVDTGMRAEYFEMMAIGDVNPKGSTEIMLKSLADEGLTPDDIDTVIYTHLHYDHVANADLFPNAVTYVQKAEIDNMNNPYPFQVARMDYFPDTPERLSKIKTLIPVDGDFKLANGIELYLTPGHSRGGQAIVVPTAEGRYVLTGDIGATHYAIFPWMDKVINMDGSETPITPVTDGSFPFLEGQFNNDWFSAYDSHYKQLALAERPEPKWILPSHEPSCIFRKYFG